MSNPLLETTERAALRRPATSSTTDTAADAGPAPHPMLTLQRQVGNSLINRMLAQRGTDTLVAREEEEKKEKMEGAPEPAKAEPPPVKEAGEGKKKEEEESNKVMAKHDPSIQREGDEEKKDEVQAKHDPEIQRKAEGEEEEVQTKRDPDVQRAAAAEDTRPEVGMEGGPVSDGLASRIQASRGSGSPLDDGTRSKMEGGFGTSFDRVRVHTDGESDSLNRKLGAKAFTTGNDIYFRHDTSPSDHGLLAHELTHVVQQRDMSSGSTMHVGPAGDAHEANADSMSASVNSSAAAPAAQRKTDER
jgi:hypothetical protein